MSSGAKEVISRPSKRTRPRRGRSRPVIVLSSDVLPAPFAPSTAVMPPCSTVRLTLSIARTGPYDALRSSTSSTGCESLAVSRAEVGLEHVRVLLHLRGRSARDQPARVEHHDLVANRHHEVHPMLDDKHGHCAAEAANQLAELA